MGFLFNSAETSEKIRGIKDVDLPTLTNEQIVLLALARLYEGEGIDDHVLVAEMYHRAGRKEN